MGGDLPPAAEGQTAPVFVVSALRDTGTAAHPGNPLERAQIVKGWADPDGTFHQQVIDVAGEKAPGEVDTKTCKPAAPGRTGLCAVWRDPDFDPKQGAVYYARVLEVPSCRYLAYQCNEAPPDLRPAICDDDRYPKTTQERAWTSPIWYTPPDAS